jgi:spermidine synthase
MDLPDRLSPGVTYPEAAVFVSGVASMGLEILAGRVVAPEFGTGIYTWGSIIGVFLAALSLGYHYGGKRAAERASPEALVRVLVWTAAYVGFLIVAGDALLSATALVPLPTRFASLPAVTVLFGPPTYFLGFISPYAAELSATEGVGEASGRVYAVGTVGSIVGAFGTTFFLVPEFGIATIEFGFGLLLVATALAIAFAPDYEGSLVPVGAVALLLVGALAGAAVGVATPGNTVYETQTAYQQLEVVDSGDTRTLYLDGQRHSAMDLDDPDRHVFTYTRYFHLPYLFADDPGEIDRVLFVGGGGFTGPKRFVEEYDVTVDVAEIDPEVVRVAREYFRVEESDDLRIHAVGGRRFLDRTNRTYDLIVLDAYKKDRVPFQLTTVEFMRLASRRLDEDGVLFANLIAAPEGPASRFYRAQYRTMSRVFPQVYSFPTTGGSFVQNVELVATKSPERVTQATLRERNRRRSIGIDLSAAIEDYRADAPTDDAPVLRDGDAPVDSLLEPAVGERYVVVQTDPDRAGDNATEPRPPSPSQSPSPPSSAAAHSPHVAAPAPTPRSIPG